MVAPERLGKNLVACLFLMLAAAVAPGQQETVPPPTVLISGALPDEGGGVAIQEPPALRNTAKLASAARNQPLLAGRERVDYALKPTRPGDPLVLLAISGGGSRSAYYAARVMEELSHIPAPARTQEEYAALTAPGAVPPQCGPSLLDTVRGISTVSAGGIAASYYLTHYDERYSPGFYSRFRDAMAVNLQWRTYGHMALFPPLAVQLLASSVTRTDLLADEIEKLLGGKQVTFDHLRVQETRAVDPAPVLMVNGTVYNSGQRLVVTNLPASRFPAIIEGRSESIAVSSRYERLLQNLVQPLTFEDIGSDVGQFRLAQAIAASAAYPIMLAPLALRVFPEKVPPANVARIDPKLLQSQVVYVADGGLIENEGLDSLLSLVKSMDRDQPVLLLVIDASQRMQTMALGEGKVWGLTSVLGRMYDIGSLRPLAMYSSILSNFHNPDRIEAVVIRMEGYDPETEKNLRNIPTSFKLSDTHRQALDAAAAANVRYMYEPIMHAFQRLASRPARKNKVKHQVVKGSSPKAKAGHVTAATGH